MHPLLTIHFLLSSLLVRVHVFVAVFAVARVVAITRVVGCELIELVTGLLGVGGRRFKVRILVRIGVMVILELYLFPCNKCGCTNGPASGSSRCRLHHPPTKTVLVELITFDEP